MTMDTILKKYELVCGMEVHAELSTESKMFCGCKNDPFGAAEPNMHTCPVCLGMPGGLPVPNEKAVEWTIKLGQSLGCKINQFSKFDRKHYFYPDLAKGYQISQYDIPFCEGGSVDTEHGAVALQRIHLEEDTGKLQHTSIDGEDITLVDFNRGGVPLIEIVTEPTIISPAHAAAYGRTLRSVIRFLEIGDCDMEQGGMRLEANVSLRKKEETGLPDYKVELKNINSFRFLADAISYEIERQAKLLDEGSTPAQETRGWDPDRGVSFSQRSKESAEDYRYFPDPDIPPLEFTDKQLTEWRETLPGLPTERIAYWEEAYGVEPRFSELLFETTSTAQILESAFAELNAEDDTAPNDLANLISNKKLSFDPNVDSAEELVARFLQATETESLDEDHLQGLITEVIANNQDEVAAYRAGKEGLMNFFVGQIMQKIGGKVDVSEIRKRIKDNI